MNGGGWDAQRPNSAPSGCSESAGNIIAECPDEEICELKAQMQEVLDELVTAERAEAQALEDALEGSELLGSNTLARTTIYAGAAIEGLWNGAVGLVSFAWDVLKGGGKLVYELGLRVSPLTAPEQFRQDLAVLKSANEELQRFRDEELEAYVILMQDPDIHCMLIEFAGDMIGAQHSLEWTESGGTLAFDVILAVFTAGAGSAASARHLSKLRRLKPIVDNLADALSRRKVGAPRITGARELEYWDFDGAEAVYDIIRGTDDIADISKHTGIPDFQVRRIKNHLFNQEHRLDDGLRRFDADPEIANAWRRLQQGDHTPNDLQLLQHELFESKFEGVFKTDYRTAHDAANRAGRPSGLE